MKNICPRSQISLLDVITHLLSLLTLLSILSNKGLKPLVSVHAEGRVGCIVHHTQNSLPAIFWGIRHHHLITHPFPLPTSPILVYKWGRSFKDPYLPGPDPI